MALLCSRELLSISQYSACMYVHDDHHLLNFWKSCLCFQLINVFVLLVVVVVAVVVVVGFSKFRVNMPLLKVSFS